MKCKYTIYNKNIYARPLAFLCSYLHKNTTKSLALGQPASISVFIQHIERWNLAKRKEATGECFFLFSLYLSTGWQWWWWYWFVVPQSHQVPNIIPVKLAKECVGHSVDNFKIKNRFKLNWVEQKYLKKYNSVQIDWTPLSKYNSSIIHPHWRGPHYGVDGTTKKKS